MATYNITVDDTLDAILTDIVANPLIKIDKRQYAENIVHTFLEDQLRGKLKDDINNRSFTELKTYDPSKLKRKK